MKTFKLVVFLGLLLGILLNASSCAVYVKEDHGKHKGWYNKQDSQQHHYKTKPGKHEGRHKK